MSPLHRQHASRSQKGLTIWTTLTQKQKPAKTETIVRLAAVVAVVAADVVADAAVVLVRKVALQSSVQPRHLVDQPMTTLKTMSSMWMLI